MMTSISTKYWHFLLAQGVLGGLGMGLGGDVVFAAAVRDGLADLLLAVGVHAAQHRPGVRRAKTR